MANKDNTFTIVIDKFYQGFSPLAYQNSLTEYGGSGNASEMKNIDCLSDILIQGPGMTDLPGSLNEQIQFIMDKAVSDNVSYALGTTSLFKLALT